jgi:starch phosphorylase
MQTSSLSDRLRNSLLPNGVDGLDTLAELALDLHWSWNHGSDHLWRQLDPTLWELTHNPWIMLQTVAPQRLAEALAEPAFRTSVESLAQSKRHEKQQPAWFQKQYPLPPLSCIAYFSMEFMLSEALPIYSGGLGNVAGDQLKAASDLGVPVVGIGLLYQRGYFRQVIDEDGTQQALYPFNDPGQLPISPLRLASGEWLRLEISLRGFTIWLRTWQVQVGRVTLYLLDSNDPANIPRHRGITSDLYGGGPELRLKQELILGIGGWRLLQALGITPEVCHLNEGHAAFAVLERARCLMPGIHQPFDVALAITRAGTLFTTHTAVAAGFDRFAPELMERYLGEYATDKLGIPLHELLALGRMNQDDQSEPFNMAYLAIRGSGAVNGVSRLHGVVSRHLFEPLFPHWPAGDIPVGHITNGVHMPGWDAIAADDLWTATCGKDRWLGTMDTMEAGIRAASDSSLWQCRTACRSSLVDYVRRHQSRQLAILGAGPEAIAQAKKLFDPEILTLGFARRFATYKRPNLLLHDQERLVRLLTDRTRPVQLVLSGKAHPADLAGQALIREWSHFITRADLRDHVIFISDYDITISEHLVQGVDVWLNTPRRPWEASGTSGMKVLVNGGINLSELDGWWAEAYSKEVGWSLGDGQEHGDDPVWDASEADQLYALLEREVIPEFYARSAQGIPTAWVARMRESMARLTPRYSANRTVREYTDTHYLPAAAAYRHRVADAGAQGLLLRQWQHSLAAGWPGLRFGQVTVATGNAQHDFAVEVHLAHLAPHAVQVELFADGIAGAGALRQEMIRGRPLAEADNAFVYSTTVPADRPSRDFTPRIVPHFQGAAVPLEAAHILWHS